MFRVTQNASGHTLEVTVAGKVSRIDLEVLKPWQRARLVKKLRQWRDEGAKGFPPLSV